MNNKRKMKKKGMTQADRYPMTPLPWTGGEGSDTGRAPRSLEASCSNS
jgi:hypothetical protein